jgi:hypothetical protein
MLALAGLAYKKLRDEGAFERLQAAPATRRRTSRR